MILPNKFVVQATVDATLPNADFLGALTTGILKNTTASGLLSAAVALDFPTLNQNTNGTAANVSGTPALPNGTTATTKSFGDNSTKLATTAYADAAMGTGRLVRVTQRITNTQILALTVVTIATPAANHIFVPVIATLQEHTAGVYDTARNLVIRWHGCAATLFSQLCFQNIIRNRLYLLALSTSQTFDYATNDPRGNALEMVCDGTIGGGNAGNFVDVTLLYWDFVSSI
jgi:hypothetical protein